MLKIINDLGPFFDDCYRRISVREYARIREISPPTASKLLEEYRKAGLLKKEEERRFFYYFADKGSDLFIDLSRMYWKIIFQDAGLTGLLEGRFANSVIILFGSLSKAEAKPDSDVDIAVFGSGRKEVDMSKPEKQTEKKGAAVCF
jgi:DNA-binding transcriptional ArsR family regulator